MKVKKAIIPAAGLGTRFLPATKAQPKEMLPIVDKPTIQYIIEEAVDSGIEDILIITGRGKRAIEDHFDYVPELEHQLEQSGKQAQADELRRISDSVEIHYIRQRQPKGLGHAIYCAHSFIKDEPFAVMLGDDIAVCEKPALSQLIEVYDNYQNTVVGVSEVEPDKVSSYGVIDPDKNFTGPEGVYKVTGLVEKPDADSAPSNVAIFGRYVITPAIFDILEHTEPGAGGEIQLTDALRTLQKQQDMYAMNFKGRRYDVGSKIGFLRATVDFALEREDLRHEFIEYLNSKKKEGAF